MLYAVNKHNGSINKLIKCDCLAVAKKHNLPGELDKMNHKELERLVAYELYQTEDWVYFTSRDVAEDLSFGIKKNLEK